MQVPFFRSGGEQVAQCGVRNVRVFEMCGLLACAIVR